MPVVAALAGDAGSRSRHDRDCGIEANSLAALTTGPPWPAAVSLLAAFSWAITLTITVGITYRQLVAPDHLRSSVNVIGRMVAWGGQPVGAATGALIASMASVNDAYRAAAVVMITTSIFPRIALRTPPTDARV